MTKDKLKLLNTLMKEQFNAVTEPEVLRMKRGKLFVGNNEITDMDKKSIRSGAESIRGLYTWELLVKDMKYLANKQMYETSKTIDDMIFGKAMLYTIDLMEKKLDNLSKLR